MPSSKFYIRHAKDCYTFRYSATTVLADELQAALTRFGLQLQVQLLVL